MKKNWFLNIRRCAIGLSLLMCIVALFGFFPQRTITTERVFQASTQTRFQFMQQVCSERAYVDAAQSGVTITAQEVVSAGRLHVLVAEGILDAGQDAALAVVDTRFAYGYDTTPASRADFPVAAKYEESCANAAEGYFLYSDAAVEDLTAVAGQSQAGEAFWPDYSVVFTCTGEAVFLALLFLLSRKSKPTALTQTLDSIYCALPDDLQQLGRVQYQRLYRINALLSFTALVATLALALARFSGSSFLSGVMAVVRALPEYEWHLATTRYVERRFTPFWQMVSLSTLLRLDGQTELALGILDLAERQFTRKKPAEQAQAAIWRYYAAAGQGDSDDAKEAEEELRRLAPGYAARFLSGEK